jgi:serine phosphatase RsbU (regulator of sigma subunit)/ligand-binding sensor domain-containing protein
VTGFLNFRSTCALLCCAFSSLLHAQGLTLRTFEQVAFGQGLEHNRIVQTFQDSRGFLWLATDDGIARFDGIKLRFFKHEPFDAQSISDHGIEQLVEDAAGDLWILADGTLNRFERRTESFSTVDLGRSSGGIATRALVLLADRQGRVWVGTNDQGLFRIDPSTGELKQYRYDPQDPASLANNRVVSLFESRSGSIWAGTTGGGLNLFLEGPENFRRYLADTGNAFGFSVGPSVISPAFGTRKSIAEDIDGKLWVITVGGGLVHLDPESGAYRQILHRGDDPNSLGANVIYNMFRDNRGWLWLATAAGGLDKYDPTANTVTRFRHDPDDPNSLGPLAQRDFQFVQDALFNVWIGTSGEGLYVYDPYLDSFQRYIPDRLREGYITDRYITSLLYDNARNLWVGTLSGGLCKFSVHKQKFRSVELPVWMAEANGPVSISAFLDDQQGHLWIGTHGNGLLRYHLRSGSILAQYSKQEDTQQGPPSNHITVLAPAADGKIWVGTDSDLALFDQDSGRWQTQEIDDNPFYVQALLLDSSYRVWVGGNRDGIFERITNGWRFHSLARIGVNEWVDTEITDIVEADPNHLWIAHRGVGLHRWQKGQRAVVTYNHNLNDRNGLSHNAVVDLLLDRNGHLWIATMGGGVNRRFADGRFEVFTLKSHGLPSNDIFGLAESRDGRIWMASKAGLSVFNPTQGQFQHFDAGDGLVVSDPKACGFYRGVDDRFFFGGRGAFNQFFPDRLASNPHQPKLVITGYGHLGSFNYGELDYSDTLVFSYRNNSFSLDFAALDLTYPEKNQYAFMLEGFDSDWVQAGAQRQAIYTNLGGGDYVFHVRGSNNDGLWSRESASVKIRIEPPFWQADWFYGLLSLLVIVGIWLSFRYQRWRLQQQQAEALMALELERKTDELDHARRIQLSMLPKGHPDNDFFEAHGQMRTATEVGGDYYDFIPLSDGRCCLALGDATGHGFAAGLVVGMTKVSSMIWSLRRHEDPEEMLHEINLGLRAAISDRKMGMALGVAIMDSSKRQARLAFSGMPFPYVFRAATQELTSIPLKAPPLGFLRKIHVASDIVSLEPDDFMIFLSDGFNERFDRQNRMWGDHGMEDAILKICRTHNRAKEIAEALFVACDDFADGRYHDDDMTVLVVRIKS